MRSHLLDIAGTRIHVEETGTSGGEPPIVILHGFTGSAETMSTLAGLLDHRRLLLVDLVGHGRSEAPAELEPYTMARTVEHVVTVIDTLADGRADLVGYSFGGRIALSVLANHPALVERAVLIGATPGLRTPAERGARMAADETLATLIETEGLPAFVERWMALPMWDSLRRSLPEDEWDASRRQRLTCSPRGLANSLRGAGTGAMQPLHDQLADIDVPIMLVTGALDLKFTEINEWMVTQLPRASLSVVADTGHATHLERPDAVAAEIRAAFA